ncbi:hypothetical protein UFOVP1196_4 [uncultured Caudovirales phage]|uniref:Uncharacterized protein n=1 Tax=uncultured Caudovirales phage TaxID=2100421 RepID=A0A6J5QYW6_9CAUD|nr:hypothetical protein UFOVP1196_4 [uncultured Caudovirales phage]
MTPNTTTLEALQAKVTELQAELPGITFGYIGNCGVNRNGPFDDRSWYIFLPHPGRVGTSDDRVGGNLDNMLKNWDIMANVARRRMGVL